MTSMPVTDRETSAGSPPQRDAPPAPSPLIFRIGPLGALIAPLVFVLGVVIYFLILQVIDLNALTLSGLVGLLVAALFAKSYPRFWEWVVTGVSSRGSVTLIVILLAVTVVAAMIGRADVAGGFIWLAEGTGLPVELFALITFIVTCIISMATGTSLGTMFTAFPIFYPAGVLLGADPLLLAGAVLSGALFGDNLAPISDTTIVSASTQQYRRRDGVAEVGGVVRSRAPYALVAAAISAALFAVIGIMTSGGRAASGGMEAGNPLSLIMILPIALLLIVAVWKKDIFLAVTVGVSGGVITGLLSGVLTPADVISVEDGAAGGFLIDGVTTALPLVGLCVVVFGMIGVLQGAGTFDKLVALLGRLPLTRTPMGAELTIGAGAVVTTALFAGANSPALLMFGPVADRIGAQVQLHPYRRANIVDCFTMGLGVIVPLGSIFLLISSQLTQGYGDTVPALSPLSIFGVAIYPLVLTAVMLIAIFSGWGRRFEGETGAAVRERLQRSESEATAGLTVGDQRS
ncbi:Na+/H+ antiporter NhaC family protein [Microbacterium tumbae]